MTIVSNDPEDNTTTALDPDDVTADPVAQEIIEEAEHLALAIDDPEALAKSLAAFVKSHFPTRISTAYWITLSHHHERDKGIAVDIFKLPYSLRFQALVGGWSAGFGISTRPYNIEQFHAKFAVGVGAVARYDDLGKLLPVASVSIRF